MANRNQLPTDFFGDDVYTIAPQRPATAAAVVDDERWLPQEPEGQLSVDVYETPTAVVIVAPIAGVRPEELEVFVSHDLVTIRGERREESPTAERTALFSECFWGRFSRSIILPHSIAGEGAAATLRNGVLSIHLPKGEPASYIAVSEVFDDHA